MLIQAFILNGCIIGLETAATGVSFLINSLPAHSWSFFPGRTIELSACSFGFCKDVELIGLSFSLPIARDVLKDFPTAVFVVGTIEKPPSFRTEDWCFVFVGDFVLPFGDMEGVSGDEGSTRELVLLCALKGERE